MTLGRVVLLLALALFIAVAIFLAWQFLSYRAYIAGIPPGVSAAGVALDGRSQEEAARLLDEGLIGPLSKPLRLKYRDEAIPLVPGDVGLSVNVEAMISEALKLRPKQEDFWRGFIQFAIQGPSRVEVDIPVSASFDRGALYAFLADVASQRDRPMKEADLITDALTFRPGEEGQRLNLDLSLAQVEEALLSPQNREVDLVVEVTPPPRPSMELLKQVVEKRIQQFDGIVGVYIADLESGDKLEIDSGVSYSGMSVVKVGILVTTYLHFEGKEPDNGTKEIMQKLVTEPVASNYWANLLLELIGGGDSRVGAERTTQTMRTLGITKTFILGPYKIETGERHLGWAQLLRQFTNPDSMIQTSPHDMGTLLEMIYNCGKGKGTLLETFPGMITPQGCQEIQDTLALNPVRSMIGAGIPDDVKLAHKHGFANDTHADAGIVYSPGGDYVIVQFQYAETDWLVWADSQPVFADVSRATYNFFNMKAQNE